METTSFAKLRPVLERSFGVLGIPENIIQDGGLPYNGQERKSFGREIGIKMVKCIPEYPKYNGFVERFNADLVMIVHAAVAEGKDSRAEVQRGLLNYYNTTYLTIGYSPAELIMGRCMRTKIPIL